MKWTRYVFAILLALNLLLSWQLLFSEYGIRNYLAIKAAFTQYEQKIAQQEEENKKVSNQIRWIRSSPDYQEYVVRKERLYAKPSEYIYLFKK